MINDLWLKALIINHQSSIIKLEVRAYQKYVRTSPRKLRLVADVVRSLPPQTALVQLKFINKRAAVHLYKALKQAVSNAVNNQGLAVENLKIKQMEIEAGPTLKRWQAVSRGRAHRILKRMSHIKIVLESPADRLPTPAKNQKKDKTAIRSQKAKGRQTSTADRLQAAAKNQNQRETKTVVGSL